jgi:hypothetical protein
MDDFEKIHGYILLEMMEDAWEALEESPVEFRSSIKGWLLRIQLAPKVGAWEIGEVTAELLRHGDSQHHHFAAHFYRLLAKHHADAGLIVQAKDAIAKAVDLDPRQRLGILDDPILSDLL